MSFKLPCDNKLVDSTDDDQYLVQDSIVFLLDGSKQMYESDSIQQCLKTYNNIVRSKCSHNQTDNLGLILFGTKDTNCQIDNVTLLQEFEPVSVKTLKNIQSIVNGGIHEYREHAHHLDHIYPLSNALEYAFQTVNSCKINTNSQKIIILCTCKDDPPKDEQQRVEDLVDRLFKDTNTKLRVVGLTDSYDDRVFYKKLQILSGSCSDDNYETMCLKDLEKNILYLARSICNLSWEISSNIVIPVSLLELAPAQKYPSKVGKDTASKKPIKGDYKQRDEFVYYKTYDYKDIEFKPEEHLKMKNAGLELGIEVVAFKPINCDPLFRSKNTCFVTYSSEASENNKNFFRAFVSRCTAKKVMPICKVITQDSVLMCKMIPSDDDVGFFVRKIAFKNSVRDFTLLLPSYMYNNENQCQINRDAIYMFKKLTKDMEIKFDLTKFSNPKFEKLTLYLESLALGKLLISMPPDSTLPAALPEKLRKMKTALMNKLKLEDIHAVHAKKRSLAWTAEVSDSKKAKFSRK